MLSAGLELHGLPCRYRNRLERFHAHHSVFLDRLVHFQAENVVGSDADQFNIDAPAMQIHIASRRIALDRGQIDHSVIGEQYVSLTAGTQQ